MGRRGWLTAGLATVLAAAGAVAWRGRQAPAVAPTLPLTPPTPLTPPVLIASGRVELASALRAKVREGDTVIVVARVVDGPRTPVALLRLRAQDWPLAFTLDAASATAPTLRLSPSIQLVVGVRISRSGQAEPQAGELFGYSTPVAVGAPGVLIEINDTVK